MAQWIGICGVRLAPLAQALKACVLGHPVIQAEEAPMRRRWHSWRRGGARPKKAYVRVYRTTNFVAQRAVLFDFCTSRGGEHPQRVLQDFSGTLVTDDYSGYHKLQRAGAITGALCMAHARRKLLKTHKLNGSEIAAHAVALIAQLYEVEREARELEPTQRLLLRQSRAKPIADALHAWLLEKRQTLTKADITAKAIDYSLSNWRALAHYLVDGDVPIDNNAAENAIRPLAIGRKNWLFVGSQQAGERASGRDAQPDRIGQAQRARPVGVSEGCLRAPADAEEPRLGLAAAAQLALCRQSRCAGCANRGCSGCSGASYR